MEGNGGQFRKEGNSGQRGMLHNFIHHTASQPPVSELSYVSFFLLVGYIILVYYIIIVSYSNTYLCPHLLPPLEARP